MPAQMSFISYHILRHGLYSVSLSISTASQCLAISTQERNVAGKACPPNTLSAKCCSWKESGESHGVHWLSGVLLGQGRRGAKRHQVKTVTLSRAQFTRDHSVENCTRVWQMICGFAIHLVQFNLITTAVQAFYLLSGGKKKKSYGQTPRSNFLDTWKCRVKYNQWKNCDK